MERSGKGVILDVKGGKLAIQMLGGNLARMRYAADGKIPGAESLIVEEKPREFAEWQLSESPEAVQIVTEALKIHFDREREVLTFYDAKTGKVILQESPLQARKLSKAVVEGEETYQLEQTFLAAEDEVLCGLGQQQDGAMDYRGRFVHLCQYNIINAVPVLLSSKGYGILWNNCSLTEINRHKSAVRLDYNPYAKTWSGSFIPEENGEYVFTFEKLNRNRGLEKITVRIGELEVISRETPWHPNFYTGSIRMEKGKAYDILVDGTARLYYQAPSLRKYTSLWSEAGNCIDYYFMYGPEADAVVDCYRSLTGAAPLFGKWAYGFWQSRERYATGKELVEIVDEYRKRGHPLDNIVQDWQYWGSYGWNALKFHPQYAENMKAVVDKIHERHAHIMVSVWPNFGEEEGNEAYREFKEKGYLMDDAVLQRHVGNYTAALQGFQKNFYDPFNAGARDALWKKMKSGLFDIGVDGWWLDGNEPNLASIQGIYHLYRTCKGTAAKYLNAYCLMHARGIYENQRRECEKKRVYMLARTAFAGQQRYASAAWNGDIYCSWETFRRQIPAGINFCLSGLPYWGTDIGGFAGGKNEDPSFRELYIRWFQYGVFCPVFRAHGTGSFREIWQFGQEAEDIMHDYLVLRYRLMPYIYSVAWMVTHRNYTMLRGLIMDFREDPRALCMNDQFMFGPSILVCPVVEEGAGARSVYLPSSAGWYDFWTGRRFEGGQTVLAEAPLERIPLFIKEGSILPLGPELQYTDEKPAEPIEVRIYCGKDACFHLYEDEGESYNYEKGQYAEIFMEWKEKAKVLTIHKRKGQYAGMLKERTFEIVKINEGNATGYPPCIGGSRRVAYSGKEVVLNL